MLIRRGQSTKRLGKTDCNPPHSLWRVASTDHLGDNPRPPQPVKKWNDAVFSTSAAAVSPGDHGRIS